MSYQDGNLHIVDRKLKVGGNMTLSDISGSNAVFSPIAIIHHTGQVTGNTTSGQYQADLLDVTSNKWITDQGYIILYKKQH